MYRRRYYNYYRFYPHKATKREKLSRIVSGIDTDIIKKLFSLSSNYLDLLFKEYEKSYGKSSAKYARKTYFEWKVGTKKMTGVTAEKFVNLVPRLLSYDERYELVKKIYESNRGYEYHTVDFVLGLNTNNSKNKLIKIFEELCKKPLLQSLPDPVTQKINWICDKDSVQVRKIMATLDVEKSLMIVEIAKKEIDRLFSSMELLRDSVLGTHTINMPYGVINVIVRKPTFWEKMKNL